MYNKAMDMSKIKLWVILTALIQLVACSDTPLDSAAEDTVETDPDALVSISGRNVTFLPLSILETSSEYSGFDADNLYVTERYFPFIHGVLLAMFDAKTLEAETGTVDDFIITEDAQVVDSLESFPILQRVGVIPTYLHTAIVIDVSGSVADTVGFNKIVSETKTLIESLQASSDPVIANQRFTVWAFARDARQLTAGFTADKIVLDAALDRILTETIPNGSNLNQAIIEAIGRYEGAGGEGSGSDDFNFRDTGIENNDLIEGVSTERIQLSSLILVTSGSDNLHVFDDEQVKTAIESQSQVVFGTSSDEAEVGLETEAEAEAEAETITQNFGKPFIVVLVGDDSVTSESITDNASNIINLQGQAADSLSFASAVAGFQVSLIELRKRQDDRYFLRYASPFRQGSHERIITTGAVDFNNSLTAPIEIDGVQPWGMPSEVYIPNVITSVEITAENDRYLQNFININDTNVFYPTTRWTNAVYASTDYAWTLDGIAQSFNVTTGAVTINPAAITGISTLSLTNTALSETKSIQIIAGITPLLQIFDATNSFPLQDQTVARSDVGYIDINASLPVDPDNPVLPEFVFQVNYRDYNVPLESYTYDIDVPGMTLPDPNDDAAPYDYSLISGGIQIKKTSIDALSGPIIITIQNTTLGTSESFTLTL
jgi:hypothetical protein